MTFSLISHRDEFGEETGYYTREPDGVSGMTVRALAEFTGTAESGSAITQVLTRIERSNPLTNDLPDCLKVFSGRTCRLLTNDLQGRVIIPDDVCHAITEYYAFEARQYEGKDIAIGNYRIIGRAGMRLFIWAKTGYTPPIQRHPKPQLQHTTVYIERLENMRDHQVDDRLWTTFREGAEVLLLVEKDLRVPVDQLDLCDGSIGHHWSQFRVEGNWRWLKPFGSYIHRFRDQRGDRECRAYSYEELPQFKTWLRENYVPQNLPKYLADKYGKRAVRQIYGEVNGLNDYILHLTEEKRLSVKQEDLYQQFLAARSSLMVRTA